MDLYGIIGYPLSHTFSPVFFNEKFRREGIDALYEAYPLEGIAGFPQLLKGKNNLKGLNVTIPHKTAIIPFLDEIDEAAAYMGAVNCIDIQNGKLKGYNTDVIGFEKSFAPLLQSHHKEALILGTGGSSKAVKYILEKLGMHYRFVSRNGKDGALTYEALDAATLSQYTVIINCTPVGMHPDIATAPPLHYEHLGTQHYLYDLIYKPEQTLFLQKGAAQGATTKNGWDMLIGQAEANWQIWSKQH